MDSRKKLEILLTARDEASRKLRGVGDAMQDVGRTMTRRVTLPLLAAGAAASKFAMDFDDKAAQVRSTAGLTADEIEKIKPAVESTAIATGEATDDIFDAFQKAVSGSLDVAQSMNLVEQAAKATAAGFGEMERLVDVSTTAFDLFINDVDSAEQILDDIVRAAQNTQVNVEDLAGAFSRGASTASVLNVSHNELLATLGVVSERMGDTQRGGRATAQMFNDLLKPTDGARDAIDLIFGSLGNLHEMMEDDFLGAMVKMTDGLEENKLGLENVFGSSQSLAAAQMLMSDSGERATEVFNEQAGAAGAVNEAYEASESDARKLAQAKEELFAAMRPIGRIILETLIPAVQGLTERLTGLRDWYTQLNETQQKAVVKFGMVAAAIGPVLVAVGTLIKVIAFFKAAAVASFAAIKFSFLGMAAILKAPVVIPALIIGAALLSIGTLISEINEFLRLRGEVERAETNLQNIQSSTRARLQAQATLDPDPARRESARNLLNSDLYRDRATGGMVNAGQPYIVGERGPELFVPSSGGRVENTQDTGRMTGGDVTINGNIMLGDRQAVDRFFERLNRGQKLSQWGMAS